MESSRRGLWLDRHSEPERSLVSYVEMLLYHSPTVGLQVGFVVALDGNEVLSIRGAIGGQSKR